MAFAPECVERSRTFVLDIWAYREELREQVWALAARGPDISARGMRGPFPIAIGTVLTVSIEAPGFDVQQPTDSVVWNGSMANTSFLLTANQDTRDGSYAGTARIMSSHVPVATLHFELVVGGTQTTTRALRAEKRSIRSIFASYASADRADVLQWARGAQLAGVDVFLDVLKLRESARWERELFEHVPAKDLFCLFWSEPASRSTWVEREWRCALAERGVDYIHPVPLVDVRVVPPPDELRGLHFGGVLFMVQQYEALMKRGHGIGSA